MARLLPLLLLLAPLLAPAAAIYTWVDANGNRHYSDDPHPGAEEVQLREATTYSPPPLPAAAPPESAAPAPVLPDYRSVAVTTPAAEATVQNDAGTVAVAVASEPELARTHQFRLLLDGEPVGEPFRGGASTLANVDRGEHQVAVQVLDASGAVVAQSDPVTFFVQRYSRLFEPPPKDAKPVPGAPQQAPRAPMMPRAPRASAPPAKP